ncbi:zinc finger CCCH domain-containing protein 13 isoform X2 [Cinnamomum micranthum f. kanehirae]|uniref:Zinc finger CCCH domain-containing protein 13 isoform X2 n=1 Tax=Cinnamomum micranthum f. kanehirae TaxID=337451 RepID=A0A443PPJ4_9MAGN|nr:zinc finger CCCH domain-containing protein 13 isoform X2 [Cinnamomum micranthum f. kanehirae]
MWLVKNWGIGGKGFCTGLKVCFEVSLRTDCILLQNALRQQRFVREVTIQYNLCNEPWVKYSISMVADKGLKKPLYTSARLKKGEVLYLETHSNRYELCFNGEKAVSNGMATISEAPESESEKLQNHNTHSAHTSDRNPTDRDCIIDVFRWSCCKRPYPQKVMRSIGIPLPVEHLEVLEENIDWEDIQWSQTGVWIAGKEYQLARVHFLSRS